MIFIDTTYFIGLLIPKDNWQKKVDNVHIPNEQLVINNLVLSEVLNMVSKRSKLKITDVYHTLKENCQIVCLSNDDYLTAMDLCDYYNNSINYSDCLILTTMQKLGITKIVTFDEGFKKVNNLTIIE